MTSARSEFALLLAAPDPVEADLARNLLSVAGIPCLLDGQDRDLAELGFAVHTGVARPDLLVPRSALGQARGVLSEAWGDGPLSDEDPLSSGEIAAASRRSAFVGFLILIIGSMVLAILVR